MNRKTPEEEEETLQAKSAPGDHAGPVSGEVEGSIRALSGGGRPLPDSVRTFMEPRFGVDFSTVRIHDSAPAHGLARSLGAQAFTLGSDIAFRAGAYAPDTPSGKNLLAHELTHVVQQGGGNGQPASADRMIQRATGDGHDLTSNRFRLIDDLENAYDDDVILRDSTTARSVRTGRGVQAVQQALYDIGYSLPTEGADGIFGPETASAVRDYQSDHPPLAVDGEVGPETMTALDTRFTGASPLPPASERSAPWTPACVRAILCPWSPHTIDVLRTRITLKSFNSISWADEAWTGVAWVPAPFPGGGYNTGTEIGVINSSCEHMAETLYHEVLHAEQPSSHRTTQQKESYAYRIGEEFSIAAGLGGRPSLRSTDANGREFADPARVDTFVATRYPSIPAGGGSDEIIGKGPNLGEVEVQRPDNSVYTRPAVIGEKVPGPMSTTGEVTHSTATWTCP